MNFDKKEPCTDPFTKEFISKVKDCLREGHGSVCLIIIDDLNEDDFKKFLADGKFPETKT